VADAVEALGQHVHQEAAETIMLIGVIATTFFTLLIPLVQNAEQLIIVRLLTGIVAGGAVSAAFPIAAELMPAQRRRTYGAVYEMALAASLRGDSLRFDWPGRRTPRTRRARGGRQAGACVALTRARAGAKTAASWLRNESDIGSVCSSKFSLGANHDDQGLYSKTP